MADVADFTVHSSGEYVEVTITGEPGGALDFGAHASPKFTIDLTSRSWTTGGVETTIARTVYLTAARRLPYPNQTSRDETDNGSTVTIRCMLSSWIYDDDTITGATVAAGWFTDTNGTGDPNDAGTSTYTNGSTLAYPKPIAAWLEHDRKWVTGNSHSVGMVVAHAHAQQGQEVRAVKFIATDETLNTDEVIVTSMSQIAAFSASGLSGSEFRGTLDFSGLVQGETVTIDAVIYPWVGDSFQVSVNADSYPSANLCVNKCLNDRTGGYGTSYVRVNASTGNDGTGVASSSAATAAANKFATVTAALSAAQTYNNTNYSRNNISGTICYLDNGTYTHAPFSGRAIGVIPVQIEAASGQTSVIYQDAGSSVTNGLCDWVKFKGVTLKKTAGSIIFLDMNGTITSDHGLIIEDCDFDLNGQSVYNAWVYRPSRVWCINCTGDDCGQSRSFSTASKQAIVIGCSGGFVQEAVYTAICTKDLDGRLFQQTGNAGKAVGAGEGGWFNHIGCDGGSNNIFSSSGTINSRGFALVGNVGESYGSHTDAVTKINGDSDTNTVANFVTHSNSWVGERSNELYQDTGTSTVSKTGVSFHNVYYEFNSKSDVFGTNGNLIGNWAFRYRVGGSYNVLLKGGSDTGATPGAAAWFGEIAARGDLIQESPEVDPDWTDDRSNTGTDAGDGDYTPGASTEIVQIPAGETCFPYDLYGRAVPTNGTAFAGAIQQVVTVDNLLADDLTSTAAVPGTPDIAQVHALTSDGLAAIAAALDSASIGQDHQLGAANLTASLVVLNSAAIGQVHDLNAVPLDASGATFDAPDVGQVHALSSSPLIANAAALGTPTLQDVGSGTDALLADDLLASAPLIGTPSLAQIHALIAESVISVQSALGQPGIQQENALSADGLVSVAAVFGEPDLSEVGPGTDALLADDLVASTAQIAAVTIGQIHNLVSAPLTSSPYTLGAPFLNGSEVHDTTILAGRVIQTTDLDI